MQATNSPIIVALDYPNGNEALDFLSKITPNSCRLKVGSELFTAEGPAFVWELVKDGYDVFLDLKFHDIPNTVANACAAAADLGVWMINVHCLGGRKMLEAASDALSHSLHKPLLIGVTLLTSIQDQTLSEIGLTPGIPQHVSTLAKMAKESGLDGVVCSANDCTRLRQELGSDFKLITPGIRLEKSDVASDDQQRIATPVEALQSGSNYLVIGRPIIQADDPLEKLAEISKQIGYSF
jgi:orotidine-5'-phosphate decarboxylase